MSEREFAEWQRMRGRELGPPFTLENPGPVLPVREVWKHPDNPIEAGGSPLWIVTGAFTTPASQVMQIIPPAAWDRAIIAVSETGGTGTVIQVRMGRLAAMNPNLVQAYPGGVAIPAEAPSVASQEFAGLGQLVFDMPLSTAPFWLHFRGSAATSISVSVMLQQLGW